MKGAKHPLRLPKLESFNDLSEVSQLKISKPEGKSQKMYSFDCYKQEEYPFTQESSEEVPLSKKRNPKYSRYQCSGLGVKSISSLDSSQINSQSKIRPLERSSRFRNESVKKKTHKIKCLEFPFLSSSKEISPDKTSSIRKSPCRSPSKLNNHAFLSDIMNEKQNKSFSIKLFQVSLEDVSSEEASYRSLEENPKSPSSKDNDLDCLELVEHRQLEDNKENKLVSIRSEKNSGSQVKRGRLELRRRLEEEILKESRSTTLLEDSLKLLEKNSKFLESFLRISLPRMTCSLTRFIEVRAVLDPVSSRSVSHSSLSSFEESDSKKMFLIE